jgi:predicted DNA-binding protein YlxM (UPF0122 family)
MKKKSALAFTLGLSLAVGSLTGSYTIAQANEKPAEIQVRQSGEIQPIQMDNQKPVDKNHQELLKLLQIDEQTFNQEQSNGSSLGEIATKHKVSRQAVVDLNVKQMNEQIDQGVTEKRITPQQAKEMKSSALEEVQRTMDTKPMRSGAVNDTKNHQELLKLLQVDEQTLRQEQSKGKSLGEIAKDHKVSRQAVVDLGMKQLNEQIDKGLTEKRITPEQAKDMKSSSLADVEKTVDLKPTGSENVNESKNDKENFKEMVKLLQVDEQTFKQEQRNGKSLADIASAHDVARQDVVDLAVKHMNQEIDKGLADKKITPEQAKEMKTNAVEEAQKMVDIKVVATTTEVQEQTTPEKE